jgi:hypothetical protein
MSRAATEPAAEATVSNPADVTTRPDLFESGSEFDTLHLRDRVGRLAARTGARDRHPIREDVCRNHKGLQRSSHLVLQSRGDRAGGPLFVYRAVRDSGDDLRRERRPKALNRHLPQRDLVHRVLGLHAEGAQATDVAQLEDRLGARRVEVLYIRLYERSSDGPVRWISMSYLIRS